VPFVVRGNIVFFREAVSRKRFTRSANREYFGVLWGLNNLPTERQTRRSILAAGFCLVAALLMYAPFAAYAYSAHAMSCCTGDHCPIPEHHHQHMLATPTDAMDCGHDMSGMTACTMSCCHQDERPLLTPFAFLLPHFASASAPAFATPIVATLKQIELPRTIEPLSPPPRFATAAL